MNELILIFACAKAGAICGLLAFAACAYNMKGT